MIQVVLIFKEWGLFITLSTYRHVYNIASSGKKSEYRRKEREGSSAVFLKTGLLTVKYERPIKLMKQKEHTGRESVYQNSIVNTCSCYLNEEACQLFFLSYRF